MRGQLLLQGAAFAAWVGFSNRSILGYLVRTPGSLGPGLARHWASSIAVPVTAALGLAFISWSVGKGVLRLFPGDTGDSLQDITAAALGTGALASGMVLLAMAGAFTPVPLAAGVLGAFLWSDPARSLAEFRRPRTSESRPPRGLLTAMTSLLPALALWHGLIIALAPATDASVLDYHLPIPKIYLDAGRMVAIPWLVFSHWPHLIEVFYGLPLLLGLDSAAALSNLTAGALLIWAVLRAGEDWLDPAAARMAAALMAVQPVFISAAGLARVDNWWGLFEFLAAMSVWRWKATGAKSWLIRGGILAGLGVSSKLPGALTLALLSAWVWLEQKGSLLQKARAAGTFAACGAAVCGAWFLRAWMLDGSPLWPFFSAWLGGKWGAADFGPIFLAVGNRTWPSDLAFLLLYSPQYLALPCLAVLAWANRGKRDIPAFLRFNLILFSLHALLVLRDREGWRYCLPWLPGLALTAGWGLSKMLAENRRNAALACAALAVGLYPAGLLSQNNELFAVLGARSFNFTGSPREIFLKRSVGPYAFVRKVNEFLEAAGGPRPKVLMFPATIGYYWSADYQWGDLYTQGLIPYARLAGPEELAASLRTFGITHVFVNESGLTRYGPRPLALMRGCLAAHGQALLQEDGMALWRVLP